MCKRCKHCGESNLGVLITQTSTIAARKLNGEIVEFFKESEENTQTEKVNYCFTCNKPITEDDLVETVKCTSCGKEVNHVNSDGLCDECAKVKSEAEEEAKKLASMTQEELIAMIMAQKLGKASETIPEPQVETEDITKAVEETSAPVVEETQVDDALEVATESETVEKVKEKTSKKKASKKKTEPAEVKEEEVVTANKEVIEKVSDVREAKEEIKERVENAPTPESVDAEKVGAVQDATAPVDVDTTVDNGLVEDQDILAALNNVKLGENGIPDIF